MPSWIRLRLGYVWKQTPHSWILFPSQVPSTNHPQLEICRLARTQWTLTEYLWPAWFISILCIHVHVSVCICQNMWRYSEETRREHHVPWSWSCKQLWITRCECREPCLDPLEEQQAFLSTEASLHPLLAFLNHILKTVLMLLEIILRCLQKTKE